MQVPLPSRRTRAVLLLAAALSLACGRVYAPPARPATPANVAAALAELEALCRAREDLELVEGGLLVSAHFLEWREWEEFDDHGARWGHGAPHRVRERVLVGPERLYVSLQGIRGVWVHRRSFGTSVEIALRGPRSPAILDASDRDEAERLAASLDLLRRAPGS